MADERTKHLRRLRRLQRSARGWSVRAGLLAGASAVLVPYHGLGLPDAAWAAAAGGSLAIAAWRWIDLRAFAQHPVPAPLSPEMAAAETRARIMNAVLRLPAGQTVVEELHRLRMNYRMRGMAVADLWRRLDRASSTLAGFSGRLTGPAAVTVVDAVAAERSLRELADRSASVERAIRSVGGRGSQPLIEANNALLSQLAEGVGAYEQLVTAAAAYIAEDSRMTGSPPAVSGLAEAAELLRCVAESMSELRKTTPS
ncbi:MAG: hypothetical protein JXA67_03000 [Micromonosporaceae bacterium]|nr:hypothetical protein [Micromonosporaceae bacterium]